MTIKQFIAEGRHAQAQAINRYILNHSDIFEGHVFKEGKELEFDHEAYEILDKQYPLISITEFGVPEAEVEKMKQTFLAELLKEKAEKEEILKRLTESMEEANELKGLKFQTELLISEKDKMAEKLATTESELHTVKVQYDVDKQKFEEVKQKLEDTQKTLEQSQEEVDRLKNRGFFERLLNK